MSELPDIIFVDDDPKAGELMMRFSEDAPFNCHVFQDPEAALKYFSSDGADLIVSDLRMPSLTGTELLKEIRQLNKDVPFIIITGYANVDNAIEAIRLGASDFIKKPFDMDELQVLIEKNLGVQQLIEENRRLKKQLKGTAPGGMIGNAPSIKDIYRIIEKIADIRCNIIIEGESGTGKELVARAIHEQSQFADQPFVVIDCGSLSDTLLESELFGHEKGAFTGAHQAKQGFLEVATGGTVFLDEIGNISDAMQTKLMRAIQEKQITRVGGTQPIDIDVRFIVATNRDLEQMVIDSEFRHDLYHRLNVIKITMPPLRERRTDIPLLVEHFISHFNETYNRDIKGFDSESMQKLVDHDWPGNIRELQNLVEKNIALADGKIMHLNEVSSLRGETGIDSDLPTLAELEKRYIYKTLNRFNNSREKTAETLGINKSTLWRKLQSYNKPDE
ncbi:MAG: sigma-54 dependent transcriptional regulator [Gammaproteobacteria bacterium]|jgi:DNA-binding NtrC family response regulator